jgi:hypothetical protein
MVGYIYGWLSYIEALTLTLTLTPTPTLTRTLTLTGGAISFETVCCYCAETNKDLIPPPSKKDKDAYSFVFPACEECLKTQPRHGSKRKRGSTFSSKALHEEANATARTTSGHKGGAARVAQLFHRHSKPTQERQEPRDEDKEP